tara:strand:- start:1978 stop:2730 length:753 start_codon:yes stop_codon:yes gene_type:complete
MKRLTFILVFISSLVFGILSGLPLSFVMRNAGLVDQGISWQQARGTIWHGQVTGLGYRGQAVGALDVKSSPLSLLSGTIASDVKWVGQAGRARGKLKLSGSSVNLSGFAAELDIGRLSGIHPELRRIGGVLKLSNAAAHVDSAGKCRTASGATQLDLVRRLGVQYGRDWPMLTGAPACRDGNFELPLTGDGPNGERFEITLRARPDGRTGMDVHVEGLDPQATAALAAMGFTNTGNGYTLGQEATLAEGN